MKKFIVLFILCLGLFLNYITKNRVLADEIYDDSFISEVSETEDDSIFQAIFIIEYNNGNNINKLVKQRYEITDSDGLLLDSGFTTLDGCIYFTYSDNTLSNELNIRLKIYTENSFVEVMLLNQNAPMSVVYEYTLTKNSLNEYDVLISDNSKTTCFNISQFAVYINWALEDIGFYEIYNLPPKIRVYYTDGLISAYSYSFIRVSNNGFDTFGHEYGHYIADLYNLTAGPGGDHNRDEVYIGYYKGKTYLERYQFLLMMSESFATYFAAFCEDYVRENATFINNFIVTGHFNGQPIENNTPDDNGEFIEKNVFRVLWDLTDNTPEEENCCISFLDLCECMGALKYNTLNQIYTLNHLCDYLVENELIDKETMQEVLYINNITTDVLKNYNDYQNKILIELSFFEYDKDELDSLAGIKTKHYLFDRYILHIYEKVNGQFVDLNESFEIGYVNEENIVDIDGKLFFVYEFDNSLMQYINDNMFKELYFTVEQINYIEDNYMVTSYETPFQNLVSLYSGSIVKDIDFEMDTNYYTWLAYKASVTMDYNIYSEGSADVMCMVYEDIEDNNSLICGNDNKDGEDVNFLINVRLHEDEIVYLKILFPSRGEGTTVYIEPDLNVTGYLLIDSPLYAVHGTEVTLNNGEYNGLTITSGLSRIAYIPQGNWSTSRLDYDWSSSNKKVLTVSIYGTLQALKVEVNTSVIVTAVNKNNPDIIFIQNLTIQPDDTDEIRDISINMNLNLNESEYINLNNLCPNPILQSYEWHSSDEDIVDVTYYGLVTRKQAGEAVVYGTYLYNENYIVIINIS